MQRIIRLLSSVASSVIAGVVLLAHSVNAQTPPLTAPVLKAVPAVRIDAKKEQLTGTVGIAVGTDGRIVIAPFAPRDGIKAYDSTGTRRLWTAKPVTDGGMEIRRIGSIGWRGSNIVIADPGFRQFFLIGADGKLLKSIEYPTWIRPSWGDRRRFPVFESMQGLALYADGSMLVMPSNPTSPLATPEYDSTRAYVLRVSESGAIMKTIAKVPATERAGGGGEMFVDADEGIVRRLETQVPFTAGRSWATSPIGSPIVVVTTIPDAKAGRGAAAGGIVRVTALSDQGDTIYSRPFSYKPAPVTKAQVDAVLAPMLKRPRDSTRVKTLAKRIPAFHPPVLSVRVGRDQSVWLTLPATKEGNVYLGLDRTGTPIGMFTAPAAFVLMEIDRSHAWGTESGPSPAQPTIVGYRLVAPGR